MSTADHPNQRTGVRPGRSGSPRALPRIERRTSRRSAGRFAWSRYTPGECDQGQGAYAQRGLLGIASVTSRRFPHKPATDHHVRTSDLVIPRLPAGVGRPVYESRRAMNHSRWALRYTAIAAAGLTAVAALPGGPAAAQSASPSPEVK